MDGPAQFLNTWGHGSTFAYQGTVRHGTRIQYGHGAASTNGTPHMVEIVWLQYLALLSDFAGQTVAVGASRTSPPGGSLGWWLQRAVSQTALASYVAQILIHEGYARRVSDHEIRILTSAELPPGVVMPGR
jgi:hypothetical protein